MAFSGFGFGGGTPGPAPVQPSSSKDDKNITGKFDPTALERGAKALRMLDSSPNAQKAFELTRLQELTRQQEIKKEIEQMHLRQTELGAQRARIEGDERRKLAAQQQEQERITAQYKAQLESEAYQKKLIDQRRQNEEWLQQQHQQFLRQEEIRKKTELDILEMRKAQMKEEKALERENIRAKVQEESKGKIKQERENFDVHVKMMKERAIEERQTKLESLNIIFSSLGAAFSSLLADKERLTTGVTALTALAIGVYGARAGTRVLGKFMEQKIGKPPLVRDTSRWVLMNGLGNFVKGLVKTNKELKIDQIVLNDQLYQRLNWTVNSLVRAKENGTNFRHILLYGPPGTGKTLFAKTVAKRSGMDYAIMTGGDVGPLREEAASEINRLFEWSKKSKRGLVLFIDEAEAFLRKGRSSVQGMSENVRNALSAFLYHTGTETDKFCLILATNERDILDPAIVDRMDEQYEFPLPETNERKRMITLFMHQFVINPTKRGKKIQIDPRINDEFYAKVAEKTEKLSGRQLAKLCISLQSAVYGSGTTQLTLELANTVIDWHLERFNKGIADKDDI
ncbi:ATPase, AAA family domain containing protein [Theileria equi strain WA]|uniref:ATPase, AAA family domain containing protein n=1 Tax=Theileria equi strain WA TaxID=1537102 RepID=L1LD72_THEEQ|nr:ATPase, AAA family domain containing protein [Theileria equi strain WA]EKX73224.1 ATPase, AAA family domain containing protein [Theileria equi strain WA]|eukprot:XP_004832676.1 ATPase, AAA family domain containing protein [Theileria equi strain WA]